MSKDSMKFEFSGAGDLLLRHFAGSLEGDNMVSPSGREITDSSVDLNESDLLNLHSQLLPENVDVGESQQTAGQQSQGSAGLPQVAQVEQFKTNNDESLNIVSQQPQQQQQNYVQMTEQTSDFLPLPGSEIQNFQQRSHLQLGDSNHSEMQGVVTEGNYFQKLGPSQTRGLGSGRPYSAFPPRAAKKGSYSRAQQRPLSRKKYSQPVSVSSQQTEQVVAPGLPLSHKQTLVQEERLYQEKLNLRAKQSQSLRENTALRAHLKATQTDLKRKDDMIKRLAGELKQSATDFVPYQALSPTAPGNNYMAPEDIAMAAFNFHPAAKGSQNSFFNAPQAKVLQGGKIHSSQSKTADLKRTIKLLKGDLAIRDSELQNMQRNLKFARLSELQMHISAQNETIISLKEKLLNEKNKPKIDPGHVQRLEQQMVRQYTALRANEQQLAENQGALEKAHHNLQKAQAKTVNARTKMKKAIAAKQRMATKYKIIEQKANINGIYLYGGDTHGSSPRRAMSPGKQSKSNMRMELEAQQQLNQVLIEKLESMDINVHELIQTYQTKSQKQLQDVDNEETLKLLFTFIQQEEQQQFELPVDLRDITSVEQIKELLSKELQMDEGVDLKLKVRQSGEDLTSLQQVADAQLSGEGLLVEFIEIDAEEDEPKPESSQQEDYEEDNFEEELPSIRKVTRVASDKVANAFREMRLLLMVKKVPRTHMMQYLGQGREDDEVCTTAQLEKAINENFATFSEKRCVKIALFLTQPNLDEDSDDQVPKDNTLSYHTVVERLLTAIPIYAPLRGFVLTQLHNQMLTLAEKGLSDFVEDLGYDDEEDTGFLSIEKVKKSWALNAMPKLDEEMNDFFNYLAMRISDSLKQVKYKELCEAFSEDFLFEPSKHEDSNDFEPEKPDAEVFEPPKEKDGSPDGALDESLQDTDELILSLDSVLKKICDKLPQGQQAKQVFNQAMMPHVNRVYDNESQHEVLVMDPQVLLQVLSQVLELQLEDNEIFCLLKVLVRENDVHEEEQEDEEKQPDSFINYKDFYQLVCNYLRKTKVMLASEALGINYFVMSKAVFEFMLQLKKALGDRDVKLPDVLEKKSTTRQISMPDQNGTLEIKTVEFEEFLDILFMKLRVLRPPTREQEGLKLMICSQFPQNKEIQDEVLVHRLERILNDLDHIYVNIVRMLRHPDYDIAHKNAIQKLKETKSQVNKHMKVVGGKASKAASPEKKKVPEKQPKKKQEQKILRQQTSQIEEDEIVQTTAAQLKHQVSDIEEDMDQPQLVRQTTSQIVEDIEPVAFKRQQTSEIEEDLPRFQRQTTKQIEEDIPSDSTNKRQQDVIEEEESSDQSPERHIQESSGISSSKPESKYSQPSRSKAQYSSVRTSSKLSKDKQKLSGSSLSSAVHSTSLKKSMNKSSSAYSEEIPSKKSSSRQKSSVYSEAADEVSEKSSVMGSVHVADPMTKFKKQDSPISDDYSVQESSAEKTPHIKPVDSKKSDRISSTVSMELPTKQVKLSKGIEEDDVSSRYSEPQEDVSSEQYSMKEETKYSQPSPAKADQNETRTPQSSAHMRQSAYTESSNNMKNASTGKAESIKATEVMEESDNYEEDEEIGQDIADDEMVDEIEDHIVDTAPAEVADDIDEDVVDEEIEDEYF